MLNTLKTKTKFIANNLTDVQVLGQLLFGVIVLLVSWSCVRAIQTNYELQQQIAVLEKKRDIAKLENQNMELRNQFLNTNEFLELAARRQFGRAAPGEKLVIVPKQAALARTIDTKQENDQKEAKRPGQKPVYQRNIEAWLRFFFHPQDNNSV